jgi:hypothetical protein
MALLGTVLDASSDFFMAACFTLRLIPELRATSISALLLAYLRDPVAGMSQLICFFKGVILA